MLSASTTVMSHYWINPFMKKISLFFLSFFLTFSAFTQSIIYVTPSGAGNNSGSSWTNALPGNQLPSRVPTAASGAQFWVASGTYKPTTTTDRTASFSVASGVSIYGGFTGTEMSLDQRVKDANETIFSGDIGTAGYAQDNSKVIVRLTNVGKFITLDGLTIRDGRIISFDNESSGAGLLVDLASTALSLSIYNCRFINNVIVPGYSGGGAIGLTARSNSSCSLTVKNCLFSGNEGGFGGAVSPQTIGGTVTSTFEDCVFKNNKGLNDSGAISYVFVNQPDSVSLQIKRCTFLTNQALYSAGAITLGNNMCLIEDCLFDNNKVTYSYEYGGGGAVDGSSSNSTFKNCLFAYNSAAYGGVVYSNSANKATQLKFINSDFVSNIASIAGGVFYNINSTQSTSTTYNLNETYLTNCIIWQNASPDSPVFKSSVQSNSAYNQLYTTYSLIQGGYPGTGNLNLDPRFIDPGSGDYRLSSSSPAINVGDPDSVNLPTTDLAGNPRLQGGRVDMGAYEFTAPTVLFTLKNGSWTDPSVWSCNCLPGNADAVIVRHIIQIPSSYSSTAYNVNFDLNGRLDFSTDAKIQLN